MQPRRAAGPACTPRTEGGDGAGRGGSAVRQRRRAEPRRVREPVGRRAGPARRLRRRPVPGGRRRRRGREHAAGARPAHEPLRPRPTGGRSTIRTVRSPGTSWSGSGRCGSSSPTSWVSRSTKRWRRPAAWWAGTTVSRRSRRPSRSSRVDPTSRDRAVGRCPAGRAALGDRPRRRARRARAVRDRRRRPARAGAADGRVIVADRSRPPLPVGGPTAAVAAQVVEGRTPRRGHQPGASPSRGHRARDVAERHRPRGGPTPSTTTARRRPSRPARRAGRARPARSGRGPGRRWSPAGVPAGR